MKNKILQFIALTLLIAIMIPANVFAQNAATENTGLGTYNTVMLIVLILLVNLMFFPLLFSNPETKVTLEESKESFLKKLKDKLSGAKPVEEEHTILLEDNFDGIGELDNNVPPWFNILFYGTIIFAFIYMLDYHILKTGKLPLQEYADEVMAAEIQREELIRTGAFINENNISKLTDPESINSGKEIFMVNCTPCHGMNAEGTVGPNLTDQYWIHGGGVKNVFKTVKYGVPVKGMIAWQNQLNPKKMQQVVSYLLTLQGLNPGKGKAPEGLMYTEQDSTGEKSADTLNLKK